MGLLRFLILATLYMAVLMAYLYFAPNLLDIDPQPVKLELWKSFEGKYAPNERLSKAEILFEGVMEGPESLALLNGNIYTGLRTGEIVKITGDKFTKVAQIGKGAQTDGVWTEKVRGRTLGLRFNKQGKLLAADAYYGLYEVDVNSGASKALLPTTQAVDGIKMKFPDDLCIDETAGVVYMSDGSTKWGLDEIIPMVIENEDSGRIIRYDLKTGQSSVFAKGLHFPNGVQVTYDGKGLLVAEINANLIWKYHLTGAKKGEREVFARFPGPPDNIRPSPRGGYWIALAMASNSSNPNILDKGVNFLIAKKIVTRFARVLGNLLERINSIYPQDYVKDLAYRIQKMDLFYQELVNYCMIVELDANGQVLQTLQSSNTKMCYVSEVLEHDGYLYLGSFINHYLTRLKI